MQNKEDGISEFALRARPAVATKGAWPLGMEEPGMGEARKICL